jgi:hypothetical protein
MLRRYSVAFKQQMIERLTGKKAVSANQLSEETRARQFPFTLVPASVSFRIDKIGLSVNRPRLIVVSSKHYPARILQPQLVLDREKLTTVYGVSQTCLEQPFHDPFCLIFSNRLCHTSPVSFAVLPIATSTGAKAWFRTV